MKRIQAAIILGLVIMLVGGCQDSSKISGTPTAQSKGVTPGPSGRRIAEVKALYGIAAVGRGDIWAVGETDDEPAKGAVAHWDGVKWSKVTGIEVGVGRVKLEAVDSKSANDVWVAGERFDDRTQFTQVVTGHWDGRTWKTWTGLLVGTDSNDLSGVAELGPEDVWAVGHTGSFMLLMHWDGKNWREVRGPEESTPEKYKLKKVAAVSKDDVWAAGEEGLIHWDGKSWREVKEGDGLGVPEGYALLSGGGVWVFGWDTTDTVIS